MNNRTFQWLYIKSQKNIDEIAQTIFENKFSETEGEGFNLTFRNSNTIKATYTERIQFLEKTIDHKGNNISIPITTYNHVDFTIREDKKSIELKNPPRRLSGFSNFICRVTDYETAISRLTISIPIFVQFLEKNTIIQIKTIKCKNISMSGDTQAEMLIKSSSDVRNHAKEYFDNYTIVSATIHLPQISNTAKIIISNLCHLKSINCKGLENIDQIREAILASTMPCS